MTNSKHPDFTPGGKHKETTFYWGGINTAYEKDTEGSIFWCFLSVVRSIMVPNHVPIKHDWCGEKKLYTVPDEF